MRPGAANGSRLVGFEFRELTRVEITQGALIIGVDAQRTLRTHEQPGRLIERRGAVDFDVRDSSSRPAQEQLDVIFGVARGGDELEICPDVDGGTAD